MAAEREGAVPAPLLSPPPCRVGEVGLGNRTIHEDMFPPLLPPTEQDLTKLLLEGQGEAGGGSLGVQPLLQPSPYGQPGISMSHLDLRTNPSW